MATTTHSSMCGIGIHFRLSPHLFAVGSGLEEPTRTAQVEKVRECQVLVGFPPLAERKWILSPFPQRERLSLSLSEHGDDDGEQFLEIKSFGIHPRLYHFQLKL